LDGIIKKKLAEIIRLIPPWPDRGCLLADMGEYLVRSAWMLSRLAYSVVYGQYVDVYTRSKIAEMEREHDFSELDALDYLDEKHSSLK
jgi:hypothetical protein